MDANQNISTIKRNSSLPPDERHGVASGETINEKNNNNYIKENVLGMRGEGNLYREDSNTTSSSCVGQCKSISDSSSSSSPSPSTTPQIPENDGFNRVDDKSEDNGNGYSPTPSSPSVMSEYDGQFNQENVPDRLRRQTVGQESRIPMVFLEETNRLDHRRCSDSLLVRNRNPTFVRTYREAKWLKIQELTDSVVRDKRLTELNRAHSEQSKESDVLARRKKLGEMRGNLSLDSAMSSSSSTASLQGDSKTGGDSSNCVSDDDVDDDSGGGAVNESKSHSTAVVNQGTPVSNAKTHSQHAIASTTSSTTPTFSAIRRESFVNGQRIILDRVPVFVRSSTSSDPVSAQDLPETVRDRALNVGEKWLVICDGSVAGGNVDSVGISASPGLNNSNTAGNSTVDGSITSAEDDEEEDEDDDDEEEEEDDSGESGRGGYGDTGCCDVAKESNLNRTVNSKGLVSGGGNILSEDRTHSPLPGLSNQGYRSSTSLQNDIVTNANKITTNASSSNQNVVKSFSVQLVRTSSSVYSVSGSGGVTSRPNGNNVRNIANNNRVVNNNNNNRNNAKSPLDILLKRTSNMMLQLKGSGGSIIRGKNQLVSTSTAMQTTKTDRTIVEGGTSTVAIDNKIEQAMDLVKRHLMYAVREEVEILKQQIGELMERIGQLEYENNVLRSEALPETLNKLLTAQRTQTTTTQQQGQLQQPQVNAASSGQGQGQPQSTQSSQQQSAVSSNVGGQGGQQQQNLNQQVQQNQQNHPQQNQQQQSQLSNQQQQQQASASAKTVQNVNHLTQQQQQQQQQHSQSAASTTTTSSTATPQQSQLLAS